MNRAVVTIGLGVLVLVCAPAVQAADIEATVRIDAVTVYPRTAAITRSGNVSLPAGEHRLIVRGLPDPLDPASLRLSAGSSAVRLGGIEIEQIVATDFVNAEENALRNRVQDLEDRRGTVLDDIATAQTQLKLIDSVAGLPADRDGQVLVDSAALGATLTALANGADAARAKIRATNLVVRGIDVELAAAKAELEKVRTARKTTTEVRASIVVSSAVTAPISLEYRVTEAGWAWLYEARLDTEEKTLSFLRQAAITQASGENWGDAEIAVTTATPAADAGTPRVASLFLSLADFRFAGGGAADEITVTGTRLRRSTAAAEAPTPLITAQEFATEFVTEYQIPGRVTIDADRQARVYPIAQDQFEPELVARAVMPAGPEARLEAAFQYAGDAPIAAGRVQLYRDGAYVGDASLPLLLPGADVRVPFGIDDRIRILVRDERTESGERGIVGRQAVDEQRRRYEITSFHATAVPIEIIDRLPVPQESAIDVQVLEGATPATVTDLDGKAGVLLWRFAGAPQRTETIRHYYSVRYPSDRRLVGTEGGD